MVLTLFGDFISMHSSFMGQLYSCFCLFLGKQKKGRWGAADLRSFSRTLFYASFSGSASTYSLGTLNVLAMLSSREVLLHSVDHVSCSYPLWYVNLTYQFSGSLIFSARVHGLSTWASSLTFTLCFSALCWVRLPGIYRHLLIY